VPAITAPTNTATTTAAALATTTTAAAAAASIIATVRDAAAEARATLESMPHHSIDTVQVYTMLCMQHTLRSYCNWLYNQYKASYLSQICTAFESGTVMATCAVMLHTVVLTLCESLS
jgi:hypothetical protein